MVRVINAQEYAEHRSQILDAAQTLIYAKGYDQMTIQNILDTLQISKGAFYHYFGSKQALLEALIARMVDQMMIVLRPVVADERLSAWAKLEAVSRTAAGWKSERIGWLAALVNVWFADENALVRDKLARASRQQLGALFQNIIAQGIAEGAMVTDFPELAGVMVVDLISSMSIEIVGCLIVWDRLPDGPQQVARIIAACSQAIERVLGAKPGSLQLLDPVVLHDWGKVLSSRR